MDLGHKQHHTVHSGGVNSVPCRLRLVSGQWSVEDTDEFINILLSTVKRFPRKITEKVGKMPFVLIVFIELNIFL